LAWKLKKASPAMLGNIPGPSLPAPSPLVAPPLGMGTGFAAKAPASLKPISSPNLTFNSSIGHFGGTFGGRAFGGPSDDGKTSSRISSIEPQIVASNSVRTIRTVIVQDEGVPTSLSSKNPVRVMRSSSPSTRPAVGLSTGSFTPASTSATRRVGAPRGLTSLAQEQLQNIEAETQAVRAGRSEVDVMDLKQNANFWRTAHEIQSATEYHGHLARNDELRQRLQKGTEELRRLEHAAVVAEKAMQSLSRAETMAFHVEELQHEINRGHDSRMNLKANRGQDPHKLEQARSEAAQLREKVALLDKEIALVNEHQSRMSAVCAADAESLEKEIEAKARQAEILTDRLFLVQHDRADMKQQWEQTQLSLERKYEKLFKCKPPGGGFVNQERAADPSNTDATNGGA